MKRISVTLLVVSMIVGAVPAGADSRSPMGPVVNGDFESFAPGGAEACQALGNQQVDLVVAIVDTCSPGAMKAAQWSSPDPTTFDDYVVEADSPGDREARIPNAPGFDHNMWQSWANPQQAFAADFDLLTFDLEAGAIPSGANMQVGLSLSPAYEAHPFVGVFWEGAIMFRPTAGDIFAGGHVELRTPTNGTIICPGGYEPCDGFRENYAAADSAGKVRLLGETRMVQLSFWGFNGGTAPVVIDDVSIQGASTFAEASGRENENYPRRGIVGPNPLFNGDFSLAVPGTPVAPGWYGQGTANGDPNILFVSRGGDVKLRTLGIAGTAFGGPTFVGLSNERLAYSGLFEEVTFEMTDLGGAGVAAPGLQVNVFLYHALDQGTVEDEPTVSYCVYWYPSSSSAAAGLSLANRAGITDCFGTAVIEFPFTDEELANEFELGSFKIWQGSSQLYLDDFEMTGAVVVGTYMG